jgi:RsiW-degrading membrane proteinase PrsW (M82 family)
MDEALIIFFILFGLVMYFLPFIVAKARNSNRSGQVFVINFFLGWTFVGWVIALVIGVGRNKN